MSTSNSDEIIVIHPTTLDKLACRLQYHWSRNYQPVRSAPALEFGKAIHYALEDYYGKGDDPVKVFTKYIDETSINIHGLEDKERATGIAMLTNYIEHYRDTEHFHVISTEQEIARRVPVPEDDLHPMKKKFYVAARVDAIVYDQTIQKTMVLEHKTFTSFYPYYLSLGHQFVIEQYVADGIMKREKRHVDGVIYNGLRKAIKPTKGTNLFERHYIYFPKEQIKRMLYRVYWSLVGIHAGFFPIYPEPNSMVCGFCGFKEVCAEYQRGGDYQFLLDNLFVPRDTEEDEPWL